MKEITLKNLETSTQQEIFDWVTYNLLKQDRKSESDKACNYRIFKPDGTVLKCAAGWVIADDEYEKEMDGLNGESTHWVTLIEDGLVPDAHKSFICRMQEIHDRKDPSQWYEAFRQLARDYKLEYQPQMELV